MNRMSSKTLRMAVESQPEPAPPHVIHKNAVYSVDQARRALQLKESTVRREVRNGRLRIAKRAGRYYLLGAWLLEWLEAGELKRRKPLATTPAGAAGL